MVQCGFFSLILNINTNKNLNIFITKMMMVENLVDETCWTILLNICTTALLYSNPDWSERVA